MLQQFKIFAQYCYPKHAVSRLVGLLAAAEAGPLTQFLIKSFIKAFKVDMSEALESSPEAYRSFNEFFTRPLKPGIRPIDSAEDVLCLPVDGTVSQAAKIQYGRLIQAKGHDFSARTLLGGNSQLAKEFSDGDFTTIYLAPSDYHRIHMPCDAKLRSMTYVPGDLFSVNPLTAENIPNLFARNERVSVIFDTDFGPMAMVLVGATIVASIETTWAGTVTPPTGKQVVTWDYQDRDISFNKGDEMGRFKLGSTVVLLFPKDTIEFDAAMTPKTTTRLGQIMAKRLA